MQLLRLPAKVLRRLIWLAKNESWATIQHLDSNLPWSTKKWLVLWLYNPRLVLMKHEFSIRNAEEIYLRWARQSFWASLWESFSTTCRGLRQEGVQEVSPPAFEAAFRVAGYSVTGQRSVKADKRELFHSYMQKSVLDSYMLLLAHVLPEGLILGANVSKHRNVVATTAR